MQISHLGSITWSAAAMLQPYISRTCKATWCKRFSVLSLGHHLLTESSLIGEVLWPDDLSVTNPAIMALAIHQTCVDWRKYLVYTLCTSLLISVRHAGESIPSQGCLLSPCGPLCALPVAPNQVQPEDKSLKYTGRVDPHLISSHTELQ